MSSTKIGIKEPFRFIEIPLNKFEQEALPHHMQLYEQHKNAIELYMFQEDTRLLTQVVKDEKRYIRQLKDLLYELDSLRAKVFDEDLDRFDTRTFSLRRSISSILKDYNALEKSATSFIDSQNEINENIENENPFLYAEQIQIQDSLEAIKVKHSQEKLEKVEALHKDVEGLHEIYQELNTMVNDQKEPIQQIEINVENTQVEVNQGLSHLIKASRLKTAAYPVTGAVLGGLLGGPLGFLAGAKIGGLAALGCGIAGYTGGKLIKKYNEEEVEIDQTKPVENDLQPTELANKDKDN